MDDRPSDCFKGRNILVVEDEAVVSFLIEDLLLTFGCNAVWHAANVCAAVSILEKRTPDAAILDVNLAGETAYPVAARLAASGVPFVFATGYGRKGIAAEWQVRPVIQKPFDGNTLRQSLEAAIATI
jgi:CheY-like chemotaxis protein